MALKDSVLNIVVRARDRASQSLQRIRGRLRRVDQQTERTGSSFGRLARRIAGLAGAAVGIGVLTGRIRSMLNTGDRFEKLALQMEQAMGSIEEGKRATEWIKDFTANTPLQMEQVSETFIQLKNFGIDPMNGALQGIVDQASALGGGFERVRGISLALGQAWAKQRLQGEEILQLIERGVPVWELLEEVTGKNTRELQKLSEAGDLGRDTIRALIDEMGRRNTGAAADNMSLLSGITSNLRDQWALFLNEVAKSGALDFAKQQLQALLETVQRMREDGRLQAWARRISDALIGMVESVKTIIGFLAQMRTTIAVLIAMKLAQWAIAAGRGLKTLAASATAAATSTGLLAAAVSRLRKLLGVLGAFAVGFDIGRTLSEKFLVVRRAGIALAAGLTKNFERVRFAWEATQAVFTDDTIEEATRRHRRRIQQIDDQYAALFASAARAGESARDAHESSAEAADKQEQSVNKAAIAELELARVTQNLTNQIESDADRRQQALEDTSKAAEDLGFNLDAAVEGVEEEALSGAQGFRALAENISEAGLSAEDTTKVLNTGLDAVLEKIESRSGLQVLSQTVKEIGQNSALSAEQIEQLQNKIQQRGQELQDQNKETADSNREVADSVGAVNRNLEEQKQKAEAAGGAAAALANVFNAIRRTVDELGPAASAAFERLQGIDTGADELTQDFADLRQMIEDANRQIDVLSTTASADFSGLGRFLEQTALNAARVRREFAEQKLAVEELTQQFDRGNLSLSEFIRRAQFAADTSNLLGQQDLNTLRNAIESAKRDMESLRQSSESALSNLQAELAQLQGNRAEVERIRQEARIADLERQLEEAQEAGDQEAIQNARESLDVARQIFQVKMEQIEAEKRAREEEARAREQERLQEQRQARQQQDSPAPTPAPPPGQQVELNLPDGTSSSISGDPEDVNRLLEFLSQTGLRTTQ